jgi:hypothetical protein
MSIATLKKKTQSQYNNVSVGQKQFSLNGTRRSQGWVGQTALARRRAATGAAAEHTAIWGMSSGYAAPTTRAS